MATVLAAGIAAAGLIAASAPAAASPQPARKHVRKCKKSGARVVASGPAGRVLVSGDGVTWYGCAKARGLVNQLRTIDPAPDCVHICESIVQPAVAGTYAAWIYHYDFSYGGGAPDEHTAAVEVYSLTRGAQLARYPAPVSSQAFPNGSSTSSSSVAAIALAPGGTVAALVGDAGTLALRLYPLRGQMQELDRGNIDARSLRILGGEVVWTKDGQAQRFALPRGA
jgi:hypothetical protein